MPQRSLHDGEAQQDVARELTSRRPWASRGQSPCLAWARPKNAGGPGFEPRRADCKLATV